MIAIAGLLFGAILGAWRAKSRKGGSLDILQYAAVHAMLFGVIGLFATIIIHRMAM
ncbi:hypothetical protein ACRARG_01160 [Pseudooceanicola sp. C21-150M6]|uniref:hypothetical protein n=1 Tax=Pseudooceanicola sp. C21-150M6 TaxID=3434355 RepID=UPI003D7FA3D8